MRFYVDVLGGTPRHVAEWRAGETPYPSVHFDGWKINIHPVETEATPRARTPHAGSADFCLRFPGPVADAMDLLQRHGIDIEHGPTREECAMNWATSVYFRDPDGCLVELACPPEESR